MSTTATTPAATTGPKPVSQPPAGWYSNPTGPGERYWDGMRWTDSYSQPAAAPQALVVQAPQEQSGGSLGLVIAGYVFAVLMPLVGFILGIVVVTRPQRSISKHGVWVIVLSCVAFTIYLALILHAASTTTVTTTSSY